jgi:hypothetical protein
MKMLFLGRSVRWLLNGPDPLSRLRSLVQALQAQGYDQSLIFELFEHPPTTV